MMPRRSRFCIALLLYVCLSAAVHAAEAPMGVADARHFLNRIAFGATPEEIAEFARLSREQAIARALKPSPKETAVAVPAGVAEYMPRSAVRERRAMGEDAARALRREQQHQAFALRAWWAEVMLRAGTPEAALRERMTLFWHNHFVSSIAKVRSPALMLSQNELFRTHALGGFSALLHAAAKDPAMVIYLDSATNRKGSPNENFAREAMELFTLGEGHYGERDVKEAARAYTGWGLDPETGAFAWRPRFHDDGEKTVLGRRGNWDGDDVLDILLRQPQTAEFLVAKLWREFVSPQPDKAEVQRIARRWREADARTGVPRYDLRFVLNELLASPAFWAEENRGTLIKSPADLVVGTLRTFGLRDADGRPVAYALRQLGQDLLAPPNVKGWPGGEAWINTNTLLARKQFLARLLRNEEDEGMADMRVGGSASATRQRLQRALDAVHLDADAWVARADAAHLAPAQVLLATPAGIDSASGGSRETLRKLMLDASYQVR